LPVAIIAFILFFFRSVPFFTIYSLSEKQNNFSFFFSRHHTKPRTFFFLLRVTDRNHGC
jgi:hypothetical protein